MNRIELLELINSIPVDKKEYTVLSTGALVVRGIWEEAHDLDLAVTEKGLEEFKKHYDVKPKNEKWYIVNDLIECCIDPMDDKRELVEGLYLQDINNYYEFLITAKREKDIPKIEVVEKYMKGE